MLVPILPSFMTSFSKALGCFEEGFSSLKHQLGSLVKILLTLGLFGILCLFTVTVPLTIVSVCEFPDSCPLASFANSVLLCAALLVHSVIDSVTA